MGMGNLHMHALASLCIGFPGSGSAIAVGGWAVQLRRFCGLQILPTTRGYGGCFNFWFTLANDTMSVGMAVQIGVTNDTRHR